MSLGCLAGPRPALRAAIRFAALLEQPENELARRIAQLEAEPLFRRLLDARAVRVESFYRRFVGGKIAGPAERSVSADLPEGLSSDPKLIEAIGRIGEERFRGCFLEDGQLSDAERAKLCEITEATAAAIRALVDQMHVESEFVGVGATAPVHEAPAAIAAVEIETSRPVLAFFNREIWRGRYHVDPELVAQLIAQADRSEAVQIRRLIHDLREIDRRKTMLYQLLELALEKQARYLRSGKLEQRRPLTQREAADRLGISPSVVNRLISNRAIRMPWGRDIPLKVLLPSRKEILRDQLWEVLSEFPKLRDHQLRDEVWRRFGARVSRQTIWQYRRELVIQ